MFFCLSVQQESGVIGNLHQAIKHFFLLHTDASGSISDKEATGERCFLAVGIYMLLEYACKQQVCFFAAHTYMR